eukprot:GSChrysophyteH1.ASY1.ANO1.919.1 assembled CDS
MYVAVCAFAEHQYSSLPDTFFKSPLAFCSDISSPTTEDAHIAISAQASGFSLWHTRTRYCVKCGGSLKSRKQGHELACEPEPVGCGSTSFPRIEPAAIMLVESPCGGYALLGRKAAWPSGKYSCLAGFVEIGETPEQCVLRETLEESGVGVDLKSVKYHCSQPWPFPSSLMLGFLAKASHANIGTDQLPKITVQEDEMEHVQWVPDEMRAAPDDRIGDK